MKILKEGIFWKIIGKSKINSTNLPTKLTINVWNKSERACAFNDFVTNICQKLLIQIPKPSKISESYIDKINVKVGSKTLSINELKDVFFSLIINKSSGVAGINSMLLKKCFGLLCKTLIYLFQLYF